MSACFKPLLASLSLTPGKLAHQAETLMTRAVKQPRIRAIAAFLRVNRSFVRLRNSILILLALGAIGFAAYAGFFRTQPAPGVTFTSIKGEKLVTSELRGRVVLVNFWATDCATCLREMPRLVQTYKKYEPQGLEMVAVAMRHDPPNYVLNYTEKNALPFKVALDPMGELAKAFDNVTLTPTTIVIDKKGNMVTRIIGEPDFAKLEALIERKLADPA
jgi:thiol-disulfide isomerase/thioredoxin